MKSITVCLGLFILLFSSCNRSSNPGPVVASKTRDIYLVGWYANEPSQTVGQAAYWKNDTVYMQPGDAASAGLAMAVSGADVYVAGAGSAAE
jgi:hypothetical protein